MAPIDIKIPFPFAKTGSRWGSAQEMLNRTHVTKDNGHKSSSRWVREKKTGNIFSAIKKELIANVRRKVTATIPEFQLFLSQDWTNNFWILSKFNQKVGKCAVDNFKVWRHFRTAHKLGQQTITISFGLKLIFFNLFKILCVTSKLMNDNDKRLPNDQQTNTITLSDYMIALSHMCQSKVQHATNA